MHRRLMLAAPVLAVLRPARAAEAPLPVVASFSILADLVARVGGEAVAVSSLVGPDSDVQAFKPGPADLARLKGAAVLVQNGLGLEPWLASAMKRAGFKGRLVEASDGAKPRKLGSRRGNDPHIWMDPRNARLMVSNIASALARTDPDHAEGYAARARDLVTAISAQDVAATAAFAALHEGRRVAATTRDAYGYFAARYGIRMTTEPRAPLVDSLSPKRPGAPVIYSTALSAPGGPAATYLDLIRHDTAVFTKAMQ